MIQGSVRDSLGAEVKIQSSRFTTYPALWMMIKNGPHSAFKGAVHIDVRQAKELRMILDAFIEDNE